MSEKRINMVKETNTGTPVRSLEPGQEIGCTGSHPATTSAEFGGDPLNMGVINSGTEKNPNDVPVSAGKRLKQGRVVR